jgi:hypothetical protein
MVTFPPQVTININILEFRFSVATVYMFGQSSSLSKIKVAKIDL